MKAEGASLKIFWKINDHVSAQYVKDEIIPILKEYGQSLIDEAAKVAEPVDDVLAEVIRKNIKP